MAFTSGSSASAAGLEPPTARIGLSAVMSGMLLAVACQAVLILLGAAVGASAAEQGFALGSRRAQAWAIGIGASACLGLYIGARFAAINARAVVRRDGLLAGLFTWALFVLALTVAFALGVALVRPRWPALPVLAALLWDTVFVVLGSLLFALVGGLRGARAEARAIGLRDVRPPVFRRHHEAIDLEAYERGFFADPPEQASAGASLPS